MQNMVYFASSFINLSGDEMTIKFRVLIFIVFGLLFTINDYALASSAAFRRLSNPVSRKIQHHLSDFEDVGQRVLKDCYYPKSGYAAGVIQELQTQCPEAVRVSLQGKNLLFSNQSTKALFDEAIVGEFAKNLPKTLRVLDLSINRFPAELLPAIYPLLQRPNFRFLDVRMNAGANSAEAMRKLASAHPKKHDLPHVLRKVIWVEESYLEGDLFLPTSYKEAHRKYYRNEYTPDDLPAWKLPE